MHDRIDLMVVKEAIQKFGIAGIPDDQFTGFDGGLEAGAQVIQGDDRCRTFG